MGFRNMRLNRVLFPVDTLGGKNRIGVWFQGCKKKCPGCLSPETHDLQGGFFCSSEELFENIPLGVQIEGMSVSGGEPFDQPEELYELVCRFAERFSDDIIIFTGYRLEELQKNPQIDMERFIKKIAVLIDGRYVEEKNIKNGRPHNGRPRQLWRKLFADNVDSSELAGILGIRLDLEGDLLTLGESSVAVCNDSGEMYENIVAALIVSDEAKTFFCVEPFDCTFHCGTSVKKFAFYIICCAMDSHIFVNHQTVNGLQKHASPQKHLSEYALIIYSHCAFVKSDFVE